MSHVNHLEHIFCKSTVRSQRSAGIENPSVSRASFDGIWTKVASHDTDVITSKGYEFQIGLILVIEGCFLKEEQYVMFQT